jgi:hypothetical protein
MLPRMISNATLASFSGAISALRNPAGVAPRAAPAINAPSTGTAPGGLNLSPGANSPRGSMLDISA